MLLTTLSCQSETSTELDRQMIGPEGGTLTGDGVTLEIPAGALASEMELVLRKDESNIGVLDYEQLGGAYIFEPGEVVLRLPATLSVSGSSDAANLLFKNPEETTVWPGNTAYIDHFGTVAAASEGTPRFKFDEPDLGGSPDDPGSSHIDTLHLDAELEGTHRLDLKVTAYDFEGNYGPLNGDGYCGFAVLNLEGGSLTTGCAGGELTSSINVTGDTVSFDLMPFLAPKLPDAVPVRVIASDGEVGFAAGFFDFGTGSCYLEDCGGYGTCIPGDPPSCECDEGYEPNNAELVCDCVPQCEGRECGSDSCGGSCAPGCDPDQSCNDGICEGGDGDGGDGDGSTGDGDGDGDGDGSTGDGSTGDGDGDGSTGDGDGDGSAGDGDGDGDGDGAP
jgi:hypothetical protein